MDEAPVEAADAPSNADGASFQSDGPRLSLAPGTVYRHRGCHCTAEPLVKMDGATARPDGAAPDCDGPPLRLERGVIRVAGAPSRMDEAPLCYDGASLTVDGGSSKIDGASLNIECASLNVDGGSLIADDADLDVDHAAEGRDDDPFTADGALPIVCGNDCGLKMPSSSCARAI